MKKNLIYYSVGIHDEYAEMIKLSLKSMDNFNAEHYDVIIITDLEFYNRNFSTYKRPNTTVYLCPTINHTDEILFNRLRIFSHPKINEYENVLYLDSDIIININLNILFDRCTEFGKLYTVVEDYNIENHKRIHFSLGTYQKEDIEFFEKNNIYTFNSGTLMFKSSFLMKRHFDNVLDIIEKHTGEYFTDQSFLNYYFNTYHLTDTKKILKDVDYLYIVESNYHQVINYDNKLLHLISEQDTPYSKLEKMNGLYNKIYSKNYQDRSVWIKNINKFISGGRGVEIGVFKGDFSKEILHSWNGTLYMVDVWSPLGEEYIDCSNHAFHHDAYKNAIENIKGYEERAIMIRANSKTASEMFQDESLDFIFIDANHAYDYVVEDINLWFPKLKKGGVFSGHDYILMDWYNDPNFAENKKDKHIYTFSSDGNPFYNGIFGVNPAVDEFCEKMGYHLNNTSEWFSTWWFIK